MELLPIGSKAYVAQIEYAKEPTACPDCNGTKTWYVRTAIKGFDVPCARCGGGHKTWLLPEKTIRKVVINEVTITESNVRRKWDKETGQEVAEAKYHFKPDSGWHKTQPYATEQEALEAGQKLLEKEQNDTDEHITKSNEQAEKRARQNVLEAVLDQEAERRKAIEQKIENLKEKLLEAIQYPTLYGPEVKRCELTSEALGSWLDKMLESSEIGGWGEQELNEAMRS